MCSTVVPLNVEILRSTLKFLFLYFGSLAVCKPPMRGKGLCEDVYPQALNAAVRYSVTCLRLGCVYLRATVVPQTLSLALATCRVQRTRVSEYSAAVTPAHALACRCMLTAAMHGCTLHTTIMCPALMPAAASAGTKLCVRCSGAHSVAGACGPQAVV